jgi:PqqD family protein of HPr-rel-A system
MDADRQFTQESQMPFVWRVRPEPDVLWRCWDGEFVVYCAASGGTHHLEGLAAEVFEQLMARPSDCDALCAGIAGGFDRGTAEKLREAVPKVIETLVKAELIEPVNT